MIPIGALCVDRVVPTGAFTSPAAGNVSGVITVSVTAADNDAVASVQFQLDGANLGAPDTSAPYTISYDTRSSLNGSHTFTAIVTDRIGNQTSFTRVVTFVNLPIVTLTNPTGGTVSGNINLTATVTNYDASISVQFKIDGANQGAAQTSGPFAINGYNTHALLNGNHTFSVVATDGHGNSATSSVVCNVENSPVVTITSPGNGANISGTINFNASVTHYSSSCSIQLYIDGGTYGSSFSGSGGYSLDTHYLAAGGHTFTAIATDAQGNTNRVDYSVNCTNSLPGSGRTNLGNLMPFYSDDGQYENIRYDTPGFPDRFDPDFIWSATGTKYGTVNIPGNPDPTHYQMYLQQVTDYTEAASDGVVQYIDLMIDGGRNQFWQNGPLSGNVGPAVAVGGGNSIYFEVYESYAHNNNCWVQGCGVQYWFAVKSGYNS